MMETPTDCKKVRSTFATWVKRCQSTTLARPNNSTATPATTHNVAAADKSKEARCSNTLEGIPSGSLNCSAASQCLTNHGWREEAFVAQCHAYFGNPIKCPDGIGVNGVYITGHFADETNGYCAAWDSAAAARTFMDCTPDKKTCTTIIAKKAHMQSASAGILMMKRVKCTESGCQVFKMGKCFNVAPSVPFQNCKAWIHQNNQTCIWTDNNSYEANKLESDTQAFAALVVAQMKNATATVQNCSGADLALAEALIKAS